MNTFHNPSLFTLMGVTGDAISPPYRLDLSAPVFATLLDVLGHMRRHGIPDPTCSSFVLTDTLTLPAQVPERVAVYVHLSTLDFWLSFSGERGLSVFSVPRPLVELEALHQASPCPSYTPPRSLH